MITLCVKRVTFVVLAYLAAVLTSVVMRLALVLFVGFLWPASELWEWIGLNDVKYFALHETFLMMTFTALLFTIVPAVGLIAVGECCGWRDPQKYVGGALVALAVAAFSNPPLWLDSLTVTSGIYAMAVVLSAAAGGWIYWRIAGRSALGWDKGSAT